MPDDPELDCEESQTGEEAGILEFIVPEDAADERVDVLLTGFLKSQNAQSEFALLQGGVQPSRSKIERWIERGCVQLAGRVVKKSGQRVKAGDVVLLTVPAIPVESELLPDASVRFGIVYEDAHILVINKPANVPVHPSAGWPAGTLVHGLISYLGDSLRMVGDGLRPGIVHRLDKDTTGLLLVAKSDTAFQSLITQFQPPRTVLRKYLALTSALPRGAAQTKGCIDFPIGRHAVDRKRMAVRKAGGRAAQTFWSLQEKLRFGYLLELSLCTGRTHQIRVHLQHAGAPVLGDPLYGSLPPSYPAKVKVKIRDLKRQALHAAFLSFRHPVTGAEMSCEAPLPEDFIELLQVLR